jgi:hypothetical protein
MGGLYCHRKRLEALLGQRKEKAKNFNFRRLNLFILFTIEGKEIYLDVYALGEMCNEG